MGPKVKNSHHEESRHDTRERAIEKEGMQFKSTADQAFKNGELKDALFLYHKALLFLKGHRTPGMPSDSDKYIIEVTKIYSNLSACHFKLKNWEKVEKYAVEALKWDKEFKKAKFRKAIAIAEQGRIEDGISELEALLKEDPTNSSAGAYRAELSRLKFKNGQKQRAADKKFKGFLSRDKSLSSADDQASKDAQKAPSVTPEDPSFRPASPPPEATIEEMKD